MFEWPNNKKYALSITFDDGSQTQAEVAFNEMQNRGLTGSYFIYTGWKTANANVETWKKAKDAGNEIGNHTMTHSYFYDTWQSAANEISQSEQWILQNIGQQDHTFTHPGGQFIIGPETIVTPILNLPTEQLTPSQRQQKVVGMYEFASLLSEVVPFASTGSPGINLPNEVQKNRFHLSGEAVQNYDRAAEILNEAEGINGWAIIRFHDIVKDVNIGIMPTHYNEFIKFLDKVASDSKNGLWVAPVIEVARYIEKNTTKMDWSCIDHI